MIFMQIEMPLVSIIVLNYNNSNWVIATLNSIKAQTYQNIELIIIDDCSTDNSPELITEWLNSYNGKFEFIKHPVNKGVCAATNSGLSKAKGSFISYIATDDIFLPEKTALQIDYFLNSPKDVGMIYSDAYLIQEDGSSYYGWFIQRYRQDFSNPPSGWLFEELAIRNFIPAMSVMVRSEVFQKIGKFDERLSFEDYDMWLRLSKVYKIFYMPTPLVKYRIRQGSLMNITKNWDYSLLMILTKHLESEICQKRILQLAKSSYTKRNRENMKLLSKTTGLSHQIRKVLLIWRLPIPHLVGKILVYKIKP